MGREVGIEKWAECRPLLFTIGYPAGHNQHQLKLS